MNRRNFFKAAIGSVIAAPAIAKACVAPKAISILPTKAQANLMMSHALDAMRYSSVMGMRRSGKTQAQWNLQYKEMAEYMARSKPSKRFMGK